MHSRTIIHFKDGSTLTDREIYPHQVKDPELITSVERVVEGWHLSILKSPIISSFFIITEEFQNINIMGIRRARSGLSSKPKVSARIVGCYLKDSEPPVKCTLTMDPRTRNVIFEAIWTKNTRPDGFSRRLLPLPRGALRKSISKSMGEGLSWTAINEPPVRRVSGIPTGLSCLIALNKEKRVKAEIRLSGMNCLLSIIPE